MKKIFITIFVIVTLFTTEIYSQLLTYPNSGDVGIPAGYIEINAQIPNTNMYLNPTVNGSPSLNTCTQISYTFSGFLDGYANNVYNPPTTCNSLVYKPLQNYASNTNYFMTLMGYGGFPFSTNSFTMLTPQVFKIITTSSHMKPSGAVCDKGTAKIWQVKDAGIYGQRFEFIKDINGIVVGERPYGNEWRIAPASYYSSRIGPNISMNASCDFAVIFMNDWNAQNVNYADIFVKIYNWNNAAGNFNYYIPRYAVTQHKSWAQYITDNKWQYQMQMSIGSPTVSILDSGEFIFSATIPKGWKWCDSSDTPCKHGEYFADNYVMGWKYRADISSFIKLGDTKNTTNNTQTPYGTDFKILNKIPFYTATGTFVVRDQSGGCFGQGHNSDCAYHQNLSCSSYGCIHSWVEGFGNYGGDKIKLNGITSTWNGKDRAYYDDLVFRLTKNDAAGTSITEEIPMFRKQGAYQFDHWSPGGDINDLGHIATVGVCKYCTTMQTQPLKQLTDVIGSFVNPNGTNRTDEFSVFEDSIGEQWNPAVAINNFDEVLYCTKSANTDCGGYGVYCKMYDWNTGAALTNQFRVNPFNSLKVDTEEDQNTEQSYTEWSFPLSVKADRKTGNFLITYSYPNDEYVNPASRLGIAASYGKGTIAMSTLLIRKKY